MCNYFTYRIASANQLHYFSNGTSSGLMPRVHTLSNSRVYVHARREHPPPHFHVNGPGWEVVIEIRTLQIRKGWAPAADLAEALEWARNNQGFLLERWDYYNERDN